MSGRFQGKLSSSLLAFSLGTLIWGGGLAKSWQRGLRPNDPPYGKLWTCARATKEPGPTSRLRLAGILRDPEDELNPRELVVSVEGRGIYWLHLPQTALEGVFTDAATRATFRRWSLEIPFPLLPAGWHTVVVTAVDTHGAVGEIGRCQFDLPEKK